VADRMTDLGADLERLEREHRLRFLHKPDFGFSQAVWQWCNDASLDDVLGEMELAAGDFVRAMKQLIDVTAQIADAAGASPLRDTAREALDLLRHGVVSYTSITS
jgi:ATP-dependent RNA helicase HelY